MTTTNRFAELAERLQRRGLAPHLYTNLTFEESQIVMAALTRTAGLEAGGELVTRLRDMCRIDEAADPVQIKVMSHVRADILAAADRLADAERLEKVMRERIVAAFDWGASESGPGLKSPRLYSDGEDYAHKTFDLPALKDPTQ
jgi:hypothetical protein